MMTVDESIDSDNGEIRSSDVANSDVAHDGKLDHELSDAAKKSLRNWALIVSALIVAPIALAIAISTLMSPPSDAVAGDVSSSASQNSSSESASAEATASVVNDSASTIAAIQAAFASNDYSALAASMRDQVSLLDSTNGTTLSTVSPADVVAFLTKQTTYVNPWVTPVDGAIKTEITNLFLAPSGYSDFASDSAIWGSSDWQSESGNGTDFMVFTLDENGHISKVWYASANKNG